MQSILLTKACDSRDSLVVSSDSNPFKFKESLPLSIPYKVDKLAYLYYMVYRLSKQSLLVFSYLIMLVFYLHYQVMNLNQFLKMCLQFHHQFFLLRLHLNTCYFLNNLLFLVLHQLVFVQLTYYLYLVLLHHFLLHLVSISLFQYYL